MLQIILSGAKNEIFSEMVNLVESFGTILSLLRGSHHIFVHPDVIELINLKNVKGQAKPYQIRQFLKLVEQYNLELEED